MKTLVINHCDLDAVGCKIVLDYFNFKYDRMISVNYGDVTEETKELYEYDMIMCTDFSLPTALVEKLLALGKTVQIYDHHDYSNDDSTKDLFTLVNPKFKLVHSIEKCGTTIVAEAFNPGVRVKAVFNQFIKLVETYDLYKQKDPLWEDAQNCNRILWGTLNWSRKDVSKFDFIVDFWMNKLKKDTTWEWTKFEQEKIERAIKIEDEEYAKAYATYTTYVDTKGVKYGVSVASKKISIIANKLLKKNPDIMYLIMCNTYRGQWGRLSLRSTDESEFDCTQFLECHGHVHASGGELDEKLCKDLFTGKKQLTYTK